MLLAALVGLAVLTVPLLGGSFGTLATARLRAIGLVPIALAVQVVVISVATGLPRPVLAVAHVATYAAMGVVVLANRQVIGVVVAGAGGLCNGLVIAINGGTLPASRAAELATRPPTASGLPNSAALAHPHLGFLGDVWATPSWLPLHNVYSIGDVVLLIGVCWAVHALAGSDPRRVLSRLRGRTPATAAS